MKFKVGDEVVTYPQKMAKRPKGKIVTIDGDKIFVRFIDPITEELNMYEYPEICKEENVMSYYDYKHEEDDYIENELEM